MLYALLCYASEDEVASWSRDHEMAVLSRCQAAAELIQDFGTRGPSLRLMPTSTALTMRSGKQARVLDGPAADVREQLMGLWLFDCSTLEDAMAAGQMLVEARGLDEGALEIRPVALFDAGTSPAADDAATDLHEPYSPHLTLT